jgi:HD superfamily phosphohydrolase
MHIIKKLTQGIIILLLASNVNARVIHTIFGDIHEHDPVILELIDSKTMQRLKYIDQSGPVHYFTTNFPTFSRYEHSLGVYALLKHFQLSRNEQIAGLMHDASHTVFSHVADILFLHGEQRKDSYQDNIHDWFLTKMDVDKIIAKANLTTQDISPKNPKFKALEQDYPDMNADRIEYNLHTGLVFNDLDKNEIQNIIKSLHYKNNQWYFSDLKYAKKLGRLSTYYTKTLWGTPTNVAIYTATAAALKYALEQKYLTTDDLNFGKDLDVVNLLRKSSDPILKQLVVIISNIDSYYTLSNASDYDIYQPVKMRGFDPLVLQKGKLERLSALSIDYSKELENTHRYTQTGVYLKFINIANEQILDLLTKANT